MIGYMASQLAYPLLKGSFQSEDPQDQLIETQLTNDSLIFCI